MKRTSKATIALNLTLAGALAWMPACDKAKDGDKPDAKATAEADPKPADNAAKDPHAGMDHGEAKPAEADASETATAVADGRVDIRVDASGSHPAQHTAPPKTTTSITVTMPPDCTC